ncbi:alginate lyase family protein [Paenibacillus sp. J5C_2022]|uniref:alginate lyase family protein n=1 Tax=Paenibacillus sp. J5C2022 TaxID=2977129 RepID=UPI0021CF0363|nr:alginate lyase family protein [Paenibacillus sp. J5C2022]MCU6708231.1 alginate lyase family protein [Paenibacillus sp. J5C2022]
MTIANEMHLRWMDCDRIIAKAERSMAAPLLSITDYAAEMSEGGQCDYYSNGDYWWPNPDTPDGLPYIRKDGQSYPGAFTAHREALRGMRTSAANLAAGYAVTGRGAYAERAAALLRRFFLDEEKRMNPHLTYAQAIPGVCTGRGIGLIDTLHLIEVPAVARVIQRSGAWPAEEHERLQGWFSSYLEWMLSHPYGIEERDTDNNHAVCWLVQAAAFARFTGNGSVLAMCRDRYRNALLPHQMSADGSFPRELARSKPYGYSIFVLDNMVTLCQLLSGKGDDDLWHFSLPDGRSISLALDFLYPYLAERSSWPYSHDIEHFDDWPVGMSFMLYAGIALQDERYLALWRSLPADSDNAEVRRNTAMRQPLLWLMQ